MKRSLWLCICSVSVLALAACGDDDAAPTEDGGVDGGINTVNDKVDELGNMVANINGDVDELNDKTDDLDDQLGKLADAGSALEGRIHDLENPKIDSCSVGESCIPDGIELVSAGIDAIIERLCAMEFNCCDDNERRYKFGPGIEDEEDCKAVASNLINRGFSPDFIETDNTPYSNNKVVAYLIDMAQSLNDRDVKLELNEDALTECLDSLEARECPKFATPEVPDPFDACDADFTVEVPPCSPSRLLKGLQKEGEPCGRTLVPECDTGLVCRMTDCFSEVSCAGLCVPSAEVDDRCTSDWECDSSITELYCNRSSNSCQERAGEGDDCAYVNLFSNTDFTYGVDGTYLQNPAAMAVECKRGLTCDPNNGICVPPCSAGSLCNARGTAAGAGGSSQGYSVWSLCPDGYTCNVTENPGLKAVEIGVCRPALQTDEPCTRSPNEDEPIYHECESDRCALLGDDYVCSPPLLKVGEACSISEAGVGQLDATCETGFCAAASTTALTGKCAERCDRQGQCPDTHFCDTSINTLAYRIDGSYPCDLRRAEGKACMNIFETEASSNPGLNHRCATGYCDSVTNGEMPVCAPKLQANAECPYHPACPNGQFCNNGTCANTVGEGEACSAAAPCHYGSNLACITSTTGSEPTTECTVIGEFPNGVACNTSYNVNGTLVSGGELCESGYCTGLVCASLMGEDDDCDQTNAAKHCGEGLYCDHPVDDNKGTCKPQHFVGEPCSPHLTNQDCVRGGRCDLRADEYLCGEAAVEEETVFCDGE